MKYFNLSIVELEGLSQGTYEAMQAFMFRHPIDPTLHMELAKIQSFQLGAAGVKDTKLAYLTFDSHYNLPSWLRDKCKFEQTDDEIKLEIEQMKRAMSNSDMYEEE
jgi:hypothetical protein